MRRIISEFNPKTLMRAVKSIFSPRAKKGLIGVLVFLCVAFPIYLTFLYFQMVRAFTEPLEFTPTRIYSDVTHLSAGIHRNTVELRLRALAYPLKSPSPEILEFTLHPIRYPEVKDPLWPPTQLAAEKKIKLHFGEAGSQGALEKIEVLVGDASETLNDLFLEPELVATLSPEGASQSGQNGEVVKREIREVLSFENIPNSVKKAIIAIEDQHFLEHKGLDPKGTLRAIWVNLKTLSFAQGGSTITQQLVKNLLARRNKNLFKKINELFLALFLELRFKKEEILERYLNEVYLGQVGTYEIHGVSEGAKHFFGKKVTELNLAETALMAGLIRGPGYYSPYRHRERALERQRLVLKKMVETQQISQADARDALKLPIRLAPPQNMSNKAPFFTDYVKAELIRQLKDRLSEEEITAAGFKVYTTLDPLLNSVAQKAVAQGVNQAASALKLENSALEGALAIVDHHNGFLRALIGGKDYSQSTFNRILNMKRQVGSTFKPLVYLAALEKGMNPQGIPYGPALPVLDAPWSLSYDQGRQKWEPQNYEKEHKGWIDLRTALAHSINTVAAKLGIEVGLDAILKLAVRLGIQNALPSVPALTLGIAELSPVELLRIYATLANHGKQAEFTVIRNITLEDKLPPYAEFIERSKEIIQPSHADWLTDLLTSVLKIGSGRSSSKLGWERPSAGKTGTTSDHRDAWFAGYTPHYTAVVWVGFDQSIPAAQASPLPKNKRTPSIKSVMTGAAAALPIWIQVMKQAHAHLPPTDFEFSEELEWVNIDPHSGKPATLFCTSSVNEKYLKSALSGVDSACEEEYPKLEDPNQSQVE